MNEEKRQKNNRISTGKEIAYLAVFVALLIGVQFACSFIPGVELVSVLFISYAFVFGYKRGCIAAAAFSLLRQLVFGFYPTVLITYLIYYPLLCLLFGWIGERVKKPISALWWIAVSACVCAVFFTFLDTLITPFWYGMEWKGYFLMSLPFMLTQVVCTAITVGALFMPLQLAFQSVIKRF